MSRAIPKRYVWAVDLLDVKKTDVILEIGCGYGHSVPLICDKLATGRLTAIDRSEKMAAAAVRANREYVDSGRVRILHRDLLESRLPSGHFNKIFLYNLNVFWMDPRAEFAEIRRLLKPDGLFYIFHQPPPGHELAEFETAFTANLSRSDFEIIDAKPETSQEIRSICLISKPSHR